MVKGRGFPRPGRGRVGQREGELDLAGCADRRIGRHDVHRHLEVALLRPRARRPEDENRTDRIPCESLHDAPSLPVNSYCASSTGYMPERPALSTSIFSLNVLLLPPYDRLATRSSFVAPRTMRGSCIRFPPSRKSVCQESSRRPP